MRLETSKTTGTASCAKSVACLFLLGILQTACAAEAGSGIGLHTTSILTPSESTDSLDRNLPTPDGSTPAPPGGSGPSLALDRTRLIARAVDFRDESLPASALRERIRVLNEQFSSLPRGHEDRLHVRSQIAGLIDVLARHEQSAGASQSLLEDLVSTHLAIAEEAHASHQSEWTAQSLYWAGDAMMRQGDTSRALDTFYRVVTEFNDSRWAQWSELRFALVLMEFRQFETSAHAADLVLLHRSSDDALVTALALYVAGSMYGSAHDYAHSAARLNELIQVHAAHTDRAILEIVNAARSDLRRLRAGRNS